MFSLFQVKCLDNSRVFEKMVNDNYFNSFFPFFMNYEEKTTSSGLKIPFMTDIKIRLSKNASSTISFRDALEKNLEDSISTIHGEDAKDWFLLGVAHGLVFLYDTIEEAYREEDSGSSER